MKNSLSMLAAATAALLLAACSPTYDWREVRAAGGACMIMLPAKPSSHTRPVKLDGLQVEMTMTGAEADGTSFAVATAVLPDGAQAEQALQTMKSAMVRNAGGTVQQDKAVTITGATAATEVTAVGGADASGRPRLMVARFIRQGNRVYQLVVLGRDQAVPQEAIDTFLTSFRPV